MHLPLDSAEEMESKSQPFFHRSGRTILGAIGAIDGVVFEIAQPSLLDVPNPQDYRNRKVPWAVVYQVICDAHTRVMWASCHNIGNTNDHMAFGCSGLASRLAANPVPWPYYLLGDDAYKAFASIVTPFPGTSLTVSEDAFNFYHKRTRITVERCFGIIKNGSDCSSGPAT